MLVMGGHGLGELVPRGEKPAVVDIVVPPKITEENVRQCAELGLGRGWMQSGSGSEEAIRFGQENGIKVVHSA